MILSVSEFSDYSWIQAGHVQVLQRCHTCVLWSDGVIRLAYFNVMEAKRQSETSENRKYYQGLPITSMAVIMPFLFVASMFFPGFRYFVGLLSYGNADRWIFVYF